MLKPKRHSQHYVLLLIITISLFCWYNMGSKSGKTIIDASAEYKDYHSSRVAVRKFTDPIVECPAKFGKIMIFVVYRQESVDKGYYGVALESLRCYLKGRSYTLQLVDIDKDSRVQKACGKHKDVFFKKHCAAAEYLTDTDYMLVLDADTGVVNPHHCIEDWIDERTNLMFYVRVLNSEIVSANYMARNSRYSHEFLKKWADWEFQKRPEVNGGDNAVLQLHLLQHVVKEEKAKACEKIWRNEEETADYWQYTTCVQEALGPIRYWPNKIRIYRKTLGWARDGFITSDRWGPADFMLHGWKRSNVGDQGWFSPFKQNLNASNCGRGDVGWLWRPEKKTSDRAVQSLIYRFENSLNADRLQKAAQKVAPNVNGVQRRVMEDCYPFCDRNMGTALVICLLLATHLHAESIAPSNSTTSVSTSTTVTLDNSSSADATTSSSLFDVEEELVKIAAVCLNSTDYEQLAGNVVREFFAQLLSIRLVPESTSSIGLAELRAALKLSPPRPWLPYNITDPNEAELQSASTPEEYYELRELVMERF